MDVSTRHQLAAIAATLLTSFPLFGQQASNAADSPLMESAELNAAPAAERNALAPFATLTAEAWQSRGGIQRGGWWDALLDFGFELDTARLAGPADSTVFVQVHWMRNQRHDAAFADDTGGFNPVSGILATDHVRVFNLYYRQSWHQDACTFKVGQLAIDDDFMQSEGAGAFINSAFGAMPSQVATSLCSHCDHASAFPVYSVASPGLWLRLRPTPSFTWQTGLYYGAPGFDTKDNHGFDWQGTSHSDALAFTEVSRNFSAAGHSVTLTLGATYHGGKFDNYDAVLDGRSATSARGLFTVYLIQDFALTTDAAGKTKLAGFGRTGVSPQKDRSVVPAHADVGLTWNAPIAVRPDDLAGVAVSCTSFSHSFRAATTPDEPAATETTLELTYKAQLTARVSLQADVQWLFNPARNSAGRRNTATIVGVRSQFSL